MGWSLKRFFNNPISGGFSGTNIAQNLIDSAKKGASGYIDKAGNFVETVAAPVSNIAKPVANTIVNGVQSNLADPIEKTVSAVAEPTEKVIRDIGKETGRVGEKGAKLARSYGKETTDAYNIGRKYAGASAKAGEKIYGGLARGDFKRAAAGGLEQIDATKQAALDSTKYAAKGYTDYGREVGKTTGFKDLENVSNNVRRETDQAVDLYGPILADILADTYTAGGYSAGKTALKAIKEQGLKGVLDKDVLEEAAIQVIANKYGGGQGWQKYLTPENIRAAKEALHGDFEKAAYAKAGVDPQTAKVLRKALTDGKNVKDAIMEAMLDKASADYGIEKDALRAGVSGNVSKMVSSLAQKEFGMSPKSGDMLKQIMKGQGGKLLKDVAGDFYNVDPVIMGLSGKVIRDPKSEALQALAKSQGIDQDAINQIRSGLSGDLKGTALQALGNQLGIPQSDLQVKQLLNGNDYRGLPFQALASSLGISPTYLQTGQALYASKNKELPEIGQYDQIPTSEAQSRISEQTNKLEELKNGKKLSDIFSKSPNITKQYFW